MAGTCSEHVLSCEVLDCKISHQFLAASGELDHCPAVDPRQPTSWESDQKGHICTCFRGD